MRHLHLMFYEITKDPDEPPLIARFGLESKIGNVIPERVLVTLPNVDYAPMIANVVLLQ